MGLEGITARTTCVGERCKLGKNTLRRASDVVVSLIEGLMALTESSVHTLSDALVIGHTITKVPEANPLGLDGWAS